MELGGSCASPVTICDATVELHFTQHAGFSRKNKMQPKQVRIKAFDLISLSLRQKINSICSVQRHASMDRSVAQCSFTSIPPAWLYKFSWSVINARRPRCVRLKTLRPPRQARESRGRDLLRKIPFLQQNKGGRWQTALQEMRVFNVLWVLTGKYVERDSTVINLFAVLASV